MTKLMPRPCMALVHVPRPPEPMSRRDRLFWLNVLAWYWEGCPDEDDGACPDCGYFWEYCDCHEASP